MSTVVTPAARARWAVVVLGTAALVSVLGFGPRAVAALGVTPTELEPQAVAARAAASADVPYSATGESRGALALPDLRGFGDLASLLGDTTQTRTWWGDEAHWRVDVVDVTGERDTYGLPRSVWTWDYGRRELVTVTGGATARLPRADDLLPPQATRRLLAAVGPDDAVTALPPQRVGGRTADRVRVSPGDGRSTIARADVWVDRETGLPLRLVVVGTDGSDALTTELSRVTVGRPDPAVLTPPAAPGAERELRTAPDLVGRVAQASRWLLPPSLAGLPVTPGRQAPGDVTTYGTGLVRVAVLPLPPDVARDVVGGATSAGSVVEEVPDGRLVRIGSSLLNAVLATSADGRRAYVVTGLVDPGLLDEAAADLLDAEPEGRGPR
ncbi:hypothetical protein JQN72_17550 [Phycicoccus sp. CSK15P-2]|uniref:sigma-E factor regulatory protein RseB domain-containing protein n=1 Tax=Phycicoccus sp. CSK15P-2 TaxID=2807627 RepID=UPI001951E29C|nr:sigma-E factor regulatory protein RseB domain-containing protein [Phycicoccus sp. CSK15P-2]MBM6406045.1 hypothetical protein [Phycicoccus sp. CSK15P-2]